MTTKRQAQPPRNVKSQTYSSVTKNGRTTTRSRTVYRNGTVTSSYSSRPATRQTPARGGRGKKRTAVSPLGYRGALSPYADWITAYNDELPNCVAVAVANSLLVATGLRVDDDAVLNLHEATAGPDGVSIEDSLAYVAQHGIGGYGLAAYRPSTQLLDGSLVGMTDGLNDHAVTWTPRGLISWGSPLVHASGWVADGEAWFLDWLGEGVK